MPYGAGELTERIGLERKTLVRDDAGGTEASWAEYAEVWALVRPLTGRERQNAQRAEAVADYLVVIRERDDVLEDDRIAWRGRYLNVRFVRNRGPRRQFLEIEAELGATS